MFEFLIYKFLDTFISKHNEKKITDLLLKQKKFLKIKDNKPIVIFDVGCFRGDWTKSMLRILNKNTSNKLLFHLFDVNPKSTIYLKNLLKNTNIKFNYLALNEEKGEKEFYFNNFFESAGSSLDTIYKDNRTWVKTRKLFLQLFSLKKVKDFSVIKVNTDTLDNYCVTHNIDQIDVLKIDVEGSEQRVLLGAKQKLKSIKIIYTEIVENKEMFGKKEKEIKDFLGKNDFIFLDKYNLSFFNNIIAKDFIFVNKNF